MRKPDTILSEVHETRRRIDERTKDMTSEEITRYFSDRAAKVAAEFGFKIYANAEEAERAHAAAAQ